MQCVALLAAHPDVELVRLLGRSWAGRPYADAVPGSGVDLTVGDGLEVGDVDVVFAALPHTVAAAHAQAWLDAGAVVVDMSADFRLHRQRRPTSTGTASPTPRPRSPTAPCTRWWRCRATELRTADLIAAPGCYPTAALLGTLPALRAGLVEPRVVVDAKSGVSGAGRSPSLGVHFAEVNESVRAYGVDGHRHTAEMVEQLQMVSTTAVSLTFVPHLVPMTRGILATVYLRPLSGVTAATVTDTYRSLCDVNPCPPLRGGPAADQERARQQRGGRSTAPLRATPWW